MILTCDPIHCITLSMMMMMKKKKKEMKKRRKEERRKKKEEEKGVYEEGNDENPNFIDVHP